MDRPGSGLRRLTGLLLLLNAGLLAGGLALTYWPSRPGTAVEFNAEKVQLLDRLARINLYLAESGRRQLIVPENYAEMLAQRLASK